MNQQRPLRVAVVSPIDWRTPPRQSGSRELMASVLADGLMARGHQVTLFATADSITKARLRAICPRPLLEDPSLEPTIWNLLHLAEVFGRAQEFDIVHCHGEVAALAYAEMVETPVVLTMHETPTARQLPLFHRFARRASYVAVSEHSKLPGIPYATTIPPGVALDEYRLSPGGNYLLFVGSIVPKRGLEEIIEAAAQTHFPLVLGGPVADLAYFAQVIEPLAKENKLVYLGPIGPERRSEVYGKAVALIHLSDVPQAFRYSLVEAMACGTPIIAKNTGANAEIVQNKLSGFLVGNHEELIEAIMKASMFDRRKIRQRVLDHFSQNGMITQYLRVYEAAIQRAREQRSPGEFIIR